MAIATLRLINYHRELKDYLDYSPYLHCEIHTLSAINEKQPPYGDFYGTYINIEEGEDLTFGVRTNTKVEFWGAVDNFTLTRYTKAESTNIQSVSINSNNCEIFTLSGNKIDRLQKGINIVRDSKGNTRKVFVK